jgi:hypothetical protein
LPAFPTLGSGPFISTNACTGFTFNDDPVSYLQAVEGTELYKAEKEGIVLVKGQMLASGGEKGLTVRTEMAAVFLKPQQVALIDTRKQEPTRITVLDSAGLDGVMIKVDNATYNVNTSEEVIVTKESRTGAAKPRATLKGGVEVVEDADPSHVMKVAVHMPEYISKNPMIMCIVRHFENYASLKSRLPQALVQQIEKYRAQFPDGKRLGHLAKENLSLSAAGGSPCSACHNKIKASAPLRLTGNESGTGASQAASVPADDLRNVAYTPSPALPPEIRLLDGARLHTKDSNWYVLEDGTALLEATADLTTIDTGHGSVIARTGAVVLVTAEARLTRMWNLSDKSAGAVKASLGEWFVNVLPGSEASFVSGPGENAAELVMKDGLARRKVHVTALSQEDSLVRAQVSLVGALSKHPLLTMVRRSTRKTDRRLVTKLVKTAASLYMTTDRVGGPYYVPLAPTGARRIASEDGQTR